MRWAFAPKAAALTLLSALLLAAPAVRAEDKLEVDLDSPDSIKAAAKIVAANLYNLYPGHLPGRTPGVLPGPPPNGPYYWWQAGAMWGTYVDYWFYTGDDTYNDEARRSMVFQAGAPENNYEPDNHTLSLGNDDQAFWGMAAMLAAEVNFPNPAPDEPQWLALAQAVFTRQTQRWGMDFCNGGLRWQIPYTNGGYNYKNTIAQACLMNIGARLARYTQNETYAEWVNKIWDWTAGVGYIDEYYNVMDGATVETNCTNIDKHAVQFSTNAAVLIHASAIMYNYTNGAEPWRTRVNGLVNRTIEHFFPEGIMIERACELEDRIQCNVDQHSFKGYMHRALAITAIVAPFTRDVILKTLRSSTEGAVSSCQADGTCGFRWNTGSYDGDVAHGPAGQGMSALAALSTLLLKQEHVERGPLTNKTGGTSQGDPEAGTSGREANEAKPLSAITTGDRVGAGVVSAVLLVSFLGSLVWMAGGWWEGS